MSGYRPITDEQAREYPYRILIEYLCPQCGAGFSSIKSDPIYCSRECYVEASREDLSQRSTALWRDPTFVSKIQAARAVRGYPDPNRPEAVARRKMRSTAKNALRRSLRGAAKVGRTSELLGYTPDALRAHLEGQFLPGMSWDNYGDWEVDHRRPIASFPLDAPLRVVNALTNLQPLWKMDNRRKHARV